MCSLALRMIDTFALRVFVDDIFSTFGSYPMKIFGGVTGWLLTFVLPVACVAYVPASVVLGKLHTRRANTPVMHSCLACHILPWATRPPDPRGRIPAALRVGAKRYAITRFYLCHIMRS
ncbi:ABC-2 family transporter protein [Nonomuraea diastatica]|uniref:ABC-2 family transporter protein n=1 Tax=Nonomuraea diastatica TaxID=1848329 RepID=UPI0024821FA1|nr:ABC-2 family transporter protein [Nonomuraea diastatica]